MGSRWLVLALVLGVGIGAVLAFTTGPSSDDHAEIPLLDEPPEETPGDIEAGLAGRQDAPESLSSTTNPFANETDLAVLLQKAYWFKTRKDARARLLELLRSDPEEVERLLDLIRPENDPPIRRYGHQLETVGALLAELGTPALRAIQRRLDEKDTVYQMRMAAVLAPFGEAAGPAVPRLVELMRALPEDPPDRNTAFYVTVLGRIGKPASVILDDLDRWLDEGLTQTVEIAAAPALVRIGGPTERVFKRALDVIGTEAWTRQRQLIAAEIARLGKKAAPMIEGLLALASFEDSSNVAGTAVNLLGQIGVPDERVIAKLEKDLTTCYDEVAFSGSWGFALSRLGPKGREALLRAVDKHGPLAAGHAAGYLRAAGVSHHEIWRRFEPAMMGTPEKSTWPLWRALNRYTEAEVPVPTDAALQFGPAMLRSSSRPERNAAFVMMVYVDKRNSEWQGTMQELLAEEQIHPQTRFDIAEVLVGTKGANTRKTLEGVRALIATIPDNRPAYSLLRHFAQEHPRPVLEQWRQGVAQDTVTWEHLRRLLTVHEAGKEPRLVAPKLIREALDRHDPPRTK